MSFDDDVGALYRVPLDEFVTARNALAASLKKAGDADGSKRVKALAKPSASAWAVNQLFWQERTAFDALVETGDVLRAALEAGSSDDAERNRTAAVDEAMRRIRSLVEASGQNTTEILMRRVATSVDAIASYGSANPDPMRGRLTEDLTPPGFGAFAALAPALPDVAEPTPEDDVPLREAELERARSNLAEAERRVTHLEAELATLQDRLLEAHRSAEDAAIHLAEAETRLLEAQAKAES